MFKKEYQGGAYFEVFSAQGKDPVAHWKLSSPGIKKSFDKEVKSFVFTLEGSAATTKMQLPKDAKQLLCLLQRFLVMQVNIPKGQDFAIDLGVADATGSKRRLVLSTTYKEMQENPLHAKIPLTALKKSTWLNLCLDLQSLVTDTWKGQSYKSVESICISGNCRLRRIFTMKKQAADTTDDEELYSFFGTNETQTDVIPRQCLLAPDVIQHTQVINVTKVRCCEARNRVDCSAVCHSCNDLDLSSSGGGGGGGQKAQDAYHIAFGTKVAGKKKSSSSREGSSTSRQSKASLRSESEESNNKNTSFSSNHNESARKDRKNSDPGTLEIDPEVSIDKDSLRSSHTWTDGADGNKEAIPFVRNPHPPSHPSSGSRRKPRVKSAGKERSMRDDSTHSSNCSSAGSMRHHGNQPSSLTTGKMQACKQTSADDDLISEVIHVLKSRNQDTTTDGDDENTEEEEEEEEEGDGVYTFSSPPKSAPHGRVKKTKAPKRTHRRRKKSSDFNSQRKDGAKPETDFVSVNSSEEEEEEESIRSKVFNKRASSKNNGRLHDASCKSPKGTNRMSISRKSLREIPKDELGKSGCQKAYNVAKYQMADLSDSFEANMLQSLKREAMEMNSDDSDANVTPRAEGGQADAKGPRTLSRSKLHYVDEDSSDDTSMSTLKSPGSVKQKPHNYQEEMIILGNTFLSQSNPRDWGNVFSPPIVLGNTEDSTAQVLRDIPVEVKSGGREDTDGEEELDLLYDLVLNCYYDPKTCKYYELT